jgi:outer membrane lipoprotein
MFSHVWKPLFLIPLLSFALPACAPVISKEIRREARVGLSLQEVETNPGRYQGITVIWGGAILQNRLGEEGSILEILHEPLNAGGRPYLPAGQAGRIQGHSERFFVLLAPTMDPVLYERSLEVTVAGEIVGEKKSSSDEGDLSYPLLRAREIHVWQPRRMPDIHLGIGFGVTF